MKTSDHDSRDTRLDALSDKVRNELKETLRRMKGYLGANNLDLYLRLSDALSTFDNWTCDIIVQKVNPLATIEDDVATYKVLIGRLRDYFNSILAVLLRIRSE